MLHGHLTAQDGYAHLMGVHAWRLVFEWLQKLPETPRTGIHQIQADDIYANVHGYETLPADQCRYESHRRYVDLQYCIRGGEFIDWQLASTLVTAGEYEEEKDLQFYEGGNSLTSLHMLPGSYAIFFPSDAHRPKRKDGIHVSVDKLVIKLALHLLHEP